ncbi:MAG TPA: glycosyltransferase family 4 protein [Blastocatellia bacterium]|nr:glycosyltransferase family 4 protein [Blastocatellia bacterium]
MRIAQVAPLYESVPPKAYGGTERVVSYLTEELVRLGHDVTLFASGDSITKARLIAPCERSLRLDPNCIDQLAHHVTLIEQVFKNAVDFDVIHFHIDYLHFPVSSRRGIPNVTTLHGRLDIPDLTGIYEEFSHMPVVSISDSQRQPLPGLNWRRTVYHGLPTDLYDFQAEPEPYLAFIGRISPEKGVDKAIEIAARAGIKLKIAAKVDTVDEAYFKDRIEPLLESPLIEFLGEIGEEEKNKFLGKAFALLFPIDWPEPFGLVMIEAMGCGTPVVAFRRGAVPEVVDTGVTGFVCDDADQAIAALHQVASLSRGRCRQVFEERFSVTRMAMDYLDIYKGLAGAARSAELTL